MCGIMGYVGPRPVTNVLLKGLKRLEYRGYDSAGIALFEKGYIEIHKSEGKITNVEKLLQGKEYPESRCGIGHTRWATHGRPTTQNAHPHRTGHVVLVHNGIIENYLEIKKEIIAKGHQPQSETDSELMGFLILDEMNAGSDVAEATRRCFQKIEGSCSVVVVSEKEPGTIVGARNGSPLVAAGDDLGNHFLASDPQPILDYTNDVLFLETGDLVVLKNGEMQVRDLGSGKPVERERVQLDWTPDKMDKQGYSHYMLKEIHEQPQAWVDTLNGILDRKKTDPFPFAEQPGLKLIEEAERLIIVACGTSFHAAILGKYWLEKWAGVPVEVELASEFRYRQPVIPRATCVVAISQSGETADTLSVLREVRSRGVPTLAITNVRGSTISREADAVFFTSAGPEIGVAATKTFTSQMLVLFLWAGYLGQKKAFFENSGEIFAQLLKVPHHLESELSQQEELSKKIREVAKSVYASKGFFFIGRGYSYPIALEGALKLKEIAYIHAEGYAGGELKHGPIAMIDEEMVVVVLAPRDRWREKSISNLQEMKARGARILSIGCQDDHQLRSLSDFWLEMPTGREPIEDSLYPFHLSPVLQLLSYEIAVLKGTDVDQPRNLAKSVTVE